MSDDQDEREGENKGRIGRMESGVVVKFQTAPVSRPVPLLPFLE